MDKQDRLVEMRHQLQTAARSFTGHSGPGVDQIELECFTRDLEAAALRYARAYYALARDFGLIPESGIQFLVHKEDE